MIYPVGTRVRVRKGACAIVFVAHASEIEVRVDPVVETFEGEVVDFEHRKELRSPENSTKVVDSAGKAWMFTDEIAKRWVDHV